MNLKMNKALAERMQEAILESGMSQANISRAMSVDPSCITRWKNQKYRPRTKQLKQFADIVAVEVEWLLTGRGERNVKSSTGKTQDFQKDITNSNKGEELLKHELIVAQRKIISLLEENATLKEQLLKKPTPLSKKNGA